MNTEVNLEKVLLIEDKIWTLLEIHRFLERVVKETGISQKVTGLEERKDFEEEKKENTSTKKQMREDAITFDELALKLSEVAFLCDEWWEITHEDNINNLEKAFKHD